MEAAWEFMKRIERYPVRECGERLVSLPELAEEAGVEVLFSATRTARGCKRIHRLREGLAPAFLAAARAMNRRGWALRVEDAFRTRAIQKHLSRRQAIFDAILRRVTWENEGRLPGPAHLLRRASVLVAMRPKTGTHMSGSAIDLSVLRRRDGVEVDRGGGYITLSEATPMDSPFISRAAQRNRRAITELMAGHGFATYPFEFWHYSAGDAYAEMLAGAGRAARYGPVDMDPRTGEVTPMKAPLRRLNNESEFRTEIARALRRAERFPGNR
jgi:D-alanyl-D-alanine dipeptidase